jgi:catechol-2,3-dioxygenase
VLMCGKFGPMADFYGDVAGLTNVYSAPDGGFQCYAGSAAGYAFSIGLFRQAEGAAPSIHHYSYQVADESELDSAEAALANAGIDIEMRVDNSIKRSLFVKDPDAMRCEFYVARNPDFNAVKDADPDLIPYMI